MKLYLFDTVQRNQACDSNQAFIALRESGTFPDIAEKKVLCKFRKFRAIAAKSSVAFCWLLSAMSISFIAQSLQTSLTRSHEGTKKYDSELIQDRFKSSFVALWASCEKISFYLDCKA